MLFMYYFLDFVQLSIFSYSLPIIFQNDLSLKFYSFFHPGIWTQSFVLTRKTLYHCTMPLSLFCIFVCVSVCALFVLLFALLLFYSSDRVSYFCLTVLRSRSLYLHLQNSLNYRNVPPCQALFYNSCKMIHKIPLMFSLWWYHVSQLIMIFEVLNWSLYT
jgi:hypothetical protein